MFRKPPVAGVVLFLLAGPLAYGQTETRTPRSVTITIEGTIFLAVGKRAAERIEVLLERAPLQPVAVTYSDNVGRFRFNNVPLGVYYVLVRAEGYDETRTPVGRGGGSLDDLNSFPVSVFLRPIVQPGAIVPGTVDVGELEKTYSRRTMDEYEKAVEDYHAGSLEKAASRLEAVVLEAPSYYPAHSLLGVTYQKLGRFSAAEKNYERARETNPKAVQPLVNLGSLLLQEADSAESQDKENIARLVSRAIGVLQEAVRLDRSYRIAYYFLGAAYYKSGSLALARTNFQLAREIESEEFPVRLMLVNIDVKQQKWEEALDRLDSWRADNPFAKDRERIDELRSQVLRTLESKSR